MSIILYKEARLTKIIVFSKLIVKLFTINMHCFIVNDFLMKSELHSELELHLILVSGYPVLSIDYV